MKMINQFLVLFIVLLCLPAFASGWKNPVRSTHAMVSCDDIRATDIGLEILKKGGNAVDAAVAVGFALAVAYPQAGNIGGGGFMVIRTTKGETHCLDYREKAPLRAARDMYLDSTGQVIADASTIGYLASGVPGTVAGLYEAHQKFGSLPWQDLVAPAVRLADKGIILDRYLARSLKNNHDLFSPFPVTMEIFSRDGEPFAEGELLIQKDLAHTLKLIGKSGRDGFYRGETAAKIAGDMAQNGGLIGLDDLDTYQAQWREPIKFAYRQFMVYSMPPPSSGGVLLAEILQALQNINPADLGHNSSELIHYWVEIERQVYFDRAKHLGDIDFYPVPTQKLTDRSYANDLFARINPQYANISSAFGELVPESPSTTHFSIVDGNGNAVSSTYTLNGSYGSGVIINGTGILMNNEMDDFSVKPGYPNIYGLLGSEANAIEPGKRMLSSMTPTIVTKNDTTWAVLGSPGGSRIITTVAQVISNIVDHNMNIREAVEAPRFHHQWLPDIVRYESGGFSRDVITNLREMGHDLRPVYALGNVHALLWDPDHGEWTGWADPRINGVCKGN